MRAKRLLSSRRKDVGFRSSIAILWPTSYLRDVIYGTLVLHLNEGESKRYVSEATVMLAGQPFLCKA